MRKSDLSHKNAGKSITGLLTAIKKIKGMGTACSMPYVMHQRLGDSYTQRSGSLYVTILPEPVHI